jgi:hypothetical protein
MGMGSMYGMSPWGMMGRMGLNYGMGFTVTTVMDTIQVGINLQLLLLTEVI